MCSVGGVAGVLSEEHSSMIGLGNVPAWLDGWLAWVVCQRG